MIIEILNTLLLRSKLIEDDLGLTTDTGQTVEEFKNGPSQTVEEFLITRKCFSS